MIQADGSMDKIGIDMVTEALNRVVAEPAQSVTWLTNS